MKTVAEVDKELNKLRKEVNELLNDSKVNREILQEHYKHKIEKGKMLIEHLQVHLFIENDEIRGQIEDDMKYIKNDLNFYKKQFKKINSKGERS